MRGVVLSPHHLLAFHYRHEQAMPTHLSLTMCLHQRRIGRYLAIEVVSKRLLEWKTYSFQLTENG